MNQAYLPPVVATLGILISGLVAGFEWQLRRHVFPVIIVLGWLVILSALGIVVLFCALQLYSNGILLTFKPALMIVATTIFWLNMVFGAVGALAYIQFRLQVAGSWKGSLLGTATQLFALASIVSTATWLDDLSVNRRQQWKLEGAFEAGLLTGLIFWALLLPTLQKRNSTSHATADSHSETGRPFVRAAR